MIQVKNLSYEISGFTILNDISFEIPENQIVGFLGVNGAGKTSTLDILSGCSKYYKGSIQFDGQELSKNEQTILASVGYLPDEPPLYEDLIVKEYLEYVAGLYNLDAKKFKLRYCTVIEQFELASVQDKLISTLSKGYRQRVSLAAVLLHEPKYIFLDEPTEGLDPSQIKKIRETILKLKESHTIFLSSHILSEVENICDQLVVIDSGKIIRQGAVGEIRSEITGEKVYEIKFGGSNDVIRESLEGLKDIKVSKIDKGKIVFSLLQPQRSLNEILETLIRNQIEIYEISLHQENIESMFFNMINEGKDHE